MTAPAPEQDPRASTIRPDGTIVIPAGHLDYLREVSARHFEHELWDEVPEDALELSRAESVEDDGEPGEE